MTTEKCFAKGSPAPGSVPNGLVRLYGMRFCPFAERTRLVLHAKDIKHETININLQNKPEWFLEKNPLGLVPTLETPGGQVIYESAITCDYLDEVYNGKKLTPSDPFEKAQQKMMLENFSKITPYFYKIPMERIKGEDVTVLEGELKQKLSKLNEDLLRKKTKFFAADSITMIDYMIWPWFERLHVFGLDHSLDATPELKKWTERMLQDPAVKATIHSLENQKSFFNSYMEGKPNYDCGL